MDALNKGFERAEKEFLSLAQKAATESIDYSGSCALVMLIVGKRFYFDLI